MDIEADFSRNVWCLLGLPFDAINLEQACSMILTAAETHQPSFLSTPNLNFLCAALDDEAFRQSVINSDLSVADGFPIVLLGKLLKVPIPERVAGSDLINLLHHRTGGKPLKVFFFGGEPGVGEKASKVVNDAAGGLEAVGHFAPGFGTVEEMSRPEIIADINKHDIDFLIVSLGAKKGQAWIERNRTLLKAPIVSHLGAVINFFAGTVERAPALWQKTGMEWLWRIYQEPGLWRRYFDDGKRFAGLLIKNVLPYALSLRMHNVAYEPLTLISRNSSAEGYEIQLAGTALRDGLEPLKAVFQETISHNCNVFLDLSQVKIIDSAFLGLCLILSKHLNASGNHLVLRQANHRVRRVLVWQKMDHLLD